MAPASHGTLRSPGEPQARHRIAADAAARRILRVSNVKPEFKFCNGQRQVYGLADPLSPDPDCPYTMARALGSIRNGMLYPIKVHTAYQPRYNASGRMAQHDVL